MEAARIRVNAPQVIHESIDGEVIIINLASGNYYSTKGSGAEAWGVVQQSPGLTSHDLVTALAVHFGVPASDMETAVAAFVGELRAEGLVVDAADAPVVAVAPVAAEGVTQTFAPPLLEKYTDMQDLVLLDPVHEVDETGWPQQRPETPVGGQSA
jgi:hypothetical protein